MSYTGQVEVGGPADVRELPEVTIAKLAVGRYDNNAYLVRCTATGEALLIDAAAEPDRLAEFVRLGGEPAGAVLTTHRHADHWQGLAGAGRADRCPDAGRLPRTPRAFRCRPIVRCSMATCVHVGHLELRAIHLRGHTPGSIALHYRDSAGRDHLFTGDSLFPGGVGKTGSPDDFNSLISDVSERIFDVYDDETWFYPGHGFDSTLGAERPHLDEWRQRGW